MTHLLDEDDDADDDKDEDSKLMIDYEFDDDCYPE